MRAFGSTRYILFFILTCQMLCASGPGNGNKPLPRRSSFFKEEEKKEKRIEFQSSLGFALSAVGIGPVTPSRLDLACYGIYYAPRAAYRLDRSTSLCLGTHAQLLATNQESAAFFIPLLFGINIGNSATEDCDMPAGVFMNAGVGSQIIPYGTWIITGPNIDMGFRVKKWELRIFGLRSFGHNNHDFVIGLSLGHQFR